jgi:hypothetical protein
LRVAAQLYGSVLLDAQYLVSVLGGLYGRVNPEQALKIMKRELVPLDVEAPVPEHNQIAA